MKLDLKSLPPELKIKNGKEEHGSVVNPDNEINHYKNNDDSDNEYNILIDKMKKCMDKKNYLSSNKNEDEENFEEKENERAYPNFLKNLKIEGFENSKNSSIFDRIEQLKCYLEIKLGTDEFLKAYKYLQECQLDDENNQLSKLLGEEKVKYIPLIIQMMVCEDNCYSSEQL